MCLPITGWRNPEILLISPVLLASRMAENRVSYRTQSAANCATFRYGKLTGRVRRFLNTKSSIGDRPNLWRKNRIPVATSGSNDRRFPPLTFLPVRKALLLSANGCSAVFECNEAASSLPAFQKHHYSHQSRSFGLK